MDLFEQTPLFAYTLAMTLVPGPSSLLIAASGARFGLARCTPHLAGSVLGYELQLLTAVLGLGTALARQPALQTVLQLACAAYLLWMGWRMLGARTGPRAIPPAPLGWGAAAALQLGNPKSWLSAMASTGLFLPSAAPPGQQGAFLLCAGGAGLIGLTTWAVAGAALQRWLSAPARQAALNRTMAAALGWTALWNMSTAWAG